MGMYNGSPIGRSLFVALAMWAERRVSDFIEQHLANTEWVFATVIALGEKLFAALARWAERRVSDFIGQHLASYPTDLLILGCLAWSSQP